MNRISQVLSDLSTCLCAQLLTDNLPQVAFDYTGECEGACGQAWVMLSAAYPATQIGVVSTNPGNCGTGIGIDVELGIVRCVEVGEVDGQPPDPLKLTEAALLQTDDMLALWRAVACCRDSKDWIVGQYTPVGPEGGLVGGTLAVSILVL